MGRKKQEAPSQAQQLVEETFQRTLQDDLEHNGMPVTQIIVVLKYEDEEREAVGVNWWNSTNSYEAMGLLASAIKRIDEYQHEGEM